MFLVFVDDVHEQVVFPLSFLQLPGVATDRNVKTQTRLPPEIPQQPPSDLAGEFAVPSTGRGGHRVEPVDLLHLLLPHAPQRVGGNVEVWQLLQEQREELVLIHFHWEEKQRQEIKPQKHTLSSSSFYLVLTDLRGVFWPLGDASALM